MAKLIGYEGTCTRCKQQQRVYWAFADTKHRQAMEDGTLMTIKSNCPQCCTNQFFQSPHTMKWQRKLKPEEVEKDLKDLAGGVQLDFNAVDAQLKDEKKMENALLENDAKVEWWTKKNGVKLPF